MKGETASSLHFVSFLAMTFFFFVISNEVRNLAFKAFGWSIEEGTLTSSIGKGETASSLHFVSFLAVTERE